MRLKVRALLSDITAGSKLKTSLNNAIIYLLYSMQRGKNKEPFVDLSKSYDSTSDFVESMVLLTT